MLLVAVSRPRQEDSPVAAARGSLAPGGRAAARVLRAAALESLVVQGIPALHQSDAARRPRDPRHAEVTSSRRVPGGRVRLV